jgi:CheY-like chemotaxis protein
MSAMMFPKTLVAEDDANDSLRLQHAFKTAGVNATIHFVSDGLEVIDYLRGKQLFEKVASSTLPGLLLLDLGMPRLSGFGVLEWLRRHPHLRPTNVVAFGSADKADERNHALALGVDLYLIKPSDTPALTSLIKALQKSLLNRPKDQPVEPTPRAGNYALNQRY